LSYKGREAFDRPGRAGGQCVLFIRVSG